MNIIDRYIFQELFKIFFLGTMVLTAVLFLDKILFLTEMIINKNVSIPNVLRMLVYISPAFLVITIPMGVLVGTLITFSHFSADSEIVAMKATGISFLKMLRPVLFLSLGTYLVTNVIMVYALPWGNQSFRDLVFKVLKSNAAFEINEGVFNNEYGNMVLHVSEKDPQTQIMKGIFISDTATEKKQRIITAKEGVLLSDKETQNLILQLTDGTIHEMERESAEYRLLSFDKYNFVIDVPDPTRKGGKLMKGNRELSISELLKKIQELRDDGHECNVELVELHKKFSIPFTCLLLGFIGAPLGIKTARAGRSGGFAVSLVVILFYYVCLITGESLGGAGKLPPLFAVWMPNIFIAGIGAYLVRKTSRETPFVFFEWLMESVVESFQKLKKTLFKEMSFRV
jgi:lipopolysaccharide export system permease protein